MQVSMISFGIADCERSIQFYTEILGLQILGKRGEVTLLKAGDVTIVLNRPAGASIVEVIFPVESVATSHKTLTGRACNFVAPPHEITPGMWAATFTDPDGHFLTLLGPH